MIVDDYGLTLVTAATDEPVTLGEARDWLRAPEGEDNALIQGLIRLGRERAEAVAGRRLCTQTWDLTMPGFPCGGAILFPVNPVASVTHVKYRDADDVLQTVDSGDYELLSGRDPAILRPVYLGAWPGARSGGGDVVTVRFVAGHAAPRLVPECVRAGIRLIAGYHYDRDRGDDPDKREAAYAAADALFRMAWNGGY